MPESPEVQALAEQLDARLTGRAVTGADVVEFRIVKTRSRPPESIVGDRIERVTRHGKFLDLTTDAAHLVVSLGRHGWARLGDGPAAAAPVLLSLGVDGEPGIRFTDAGSWVSLAVWVVDAPDEVPGVASLGTDPTDPSFTRTDLARTVVGRRKQLKAVLQEQESLAGIGNAYSDEILHQARLSPVVHASLLTDAEVDRLFAATVEVLTTAVAQRRGIPIDQLKAAKVAAMHVHGRAGQPCPVCGDTIRSLTFAGTTAEYCPSCQTGGEILPLKA